MQNISTWLLAAALLPLGLAHAQSNLTREQKELDFRYLVATYNTYYAPLSWKKDLFGFDGLDTSAWLAKVAATTTDLEFYELCVDYVASLNDTHVFFSMPSDFLATLNFTADIYDGVPLIDSISRTRLPLSDFPFGIADELVSIDGEDALVLASRFQKYARQGNPRASLRLGLARVTSRPQSRVPYAPMVGDSAQVVIRRQNGALETYTVPWTKTGTPMEVGPVPNPKVARPFPQAAPLANFADVLEESRNSGISAQEAQQLGLNGYGARNPIFVAGLPSTFARRFGGSPADFYYSGVFQFDGLRIGYIRIPNYSPPSQSQALAQFEAEIAFMNENTDGLIIDEMRNTGGNLCFGENVAARLHTQPFQATGFELRAFWNRVLGFYNLWVNAATSGASAETVALYENLFREMLAANQAGKVVTAPLPLCTASLTRQPVNDDLGQPIGYHKPIMMMIDDFSTSTADSVPAMMQDSGRALIFGMRSNGAGGNNTSFVGGAYSEAVAGVTIGLQSRPKLLAVPDFPATRYVENVGVRPDVEKDYMTKENLLRSGSAFINDFLQTMAAHIRGQ